MNTEIQHQYLQALGITRWVTRINSETIEEIASKSVASLEAPNTWASLREQVAACRACTLCESRTQTVFGVGDQQADLLIVGEAPGFYEDQQGEPFVGKAGQLLNAMLKAIGLQREKVFISNVLKCRPPNNRDPLPEEVSQCTPFLEKQVELLQPKLILAVGRHAAHYLLNTDQSLSRMRQQQHRFRDTGIPLFVTYHPAYLLRNPADKGKAYEDLLQLGDYLG